MSVVVTRMQDLAPEFSNVSGVIPLDPHSGTGRPPPAPTPAVGTQTLVPSTFQPWLIPWIEIDSTFDKER